MATVEVTLIGTCEVGAVCAARINQLVRAGCIVLPADREDGGPWPPSK